MEFDSNVEHQTFLCRWPIRPPIIEGELLSSWVYRLAVANGISPASLHDIISAVAGPSQRNWVDSPTLALADYLALHTDQLADAILLTAPLRPTHLIDHKDMTSRFIAACPEILPGQVHSGAEIQRRSVHLSYCPRCLEEDLEPHMRRVWRTPLAMGCERHGIHLQHECPHCKEQVKPLMLKHLDEIWKCPHCREDLRACSPPPLSTLDRADYADTLRYLEAVLARFSLDQIAEIGKELFSRAVKVLHGTGNFWHLFFAPNEIGGELQRITLPATEWRDRKVEKLGGERLKGQSGSRRREILKPWSGTLPNDVGNGRLIGYANRYCDGDPNMDQLLDVQIGALHIVGVPDTGLYVDNAVIGSVKAREGLDAAFAAARPGDTLVILSLEFLGRSTAETMMTIHRVNQATLRLWILDPQLHTASVQGRMFIETVELLEAAKRRRHRSWSKRAIMDEVFEGRFTLQKTIVSRAKLREGGRLLLSGITPEAVAKILSISSVTVRKHRQSMLDLATTDTGSLYISK